MSDESPTRRLSQIFGSLSCLSDLQNHDLPSSRKNAGGSHHSKYAPKSSTSTQIPLPSSSNQINASTTTASNNRLHVGGGVGGAQSSRIVMGSRSTPNSPRMLPKNNQRTPPAIPQRPNAALIASPGMVVGMDADAQWSHFSSLTDHLDVHQLNNYSQGLPEINWQERCLELQLELHRTKSQSGRIRDMLRDKVSTLFSDHT